VCGGITNQKPKTEFSRETVVNVVVVGLFEEEEEGTGIASDDPACVLPRCGV